MLIFVDFSLRKIGEVVSAVLIFWVTGYAGESRQFDAIFVYIFFIIFLS